MLIRPARDDDSDALIHLIDGVYREYEGCVLDVDAEAPELRRPASHFEEAEGRLFVAEIDGSIAGCLGFVPSAHGAELRKVYVAAPHRGRGVARSLLHHALPGILERRASFIELWTDTRFHQGHRFYEGLGFTRQPRTRTLNDISRSTEYLYTLDLNPRVEQMDAGELERRLSEFVALLENCVMDGASVGFVLPLDAGEVDLYWKEVIAPVAEGSRLLLAALIAGRVMGSVQMGLEKRRNGRHRAEVMKLLVHTAARRRGIAAALMHACEDAALACGRSLLVLDTAAGDAAEQLYERLGYHRAGVIPRYATSHTGDIDTVIMYKQLE